MKKILIILLVSLLSLLIVFSFFIFMNNHKLIKNNDKCINIKYTQGDWRNCDFCNCIKESEKLASNKDKQEYQSIYNKFCSSIDGCWSKQ